MLDSSPIAEGLDGYMLPSIWEYIMSGQGICTGLVIDVCDCGDNQYGRHSL